MLFFFHKITCFSAGSGWGSDIVLVFFCSSWQGSKAWPSLPASNVLVHDFLQILTGAARLQGFTNSANKSSMPRILLALSIPKSDFYRSKAVVEASNRPQTSWPASHGSVTPSFIPFWKNFKCFKDGRIMRSKCNRAEDVFSFLVKMFWNQKYWKNIIDLKTITKRGGRKI